MGNSVAVLRADCPIRHRLSSTPIGRYGASTAILASPPREQSHGHTKDCQDARQFGEDFDSGVAALGFPVVTSHLTLSDTSKSRQQAHARQCGNKPYEREQSADLRRRQATTCVVRLGARGSKSSAKPALKHAATP